MDQRHKIWAIRAGIGAGACALLTAWMIPNTTPVARPSVIAGMSGTAEAQKPTYSAVPDSAIPSWAATLQQVPPSPPSPAMPQAAQRIADAGPRPDMATDTPSDDGGAIGNDPPPPVTMQTEAPPPAAPPSAPHDDYQARRAEWQARLGTVMQGQPGAGGEG